MAMSFHSLLDYPVTRPTRTRRKPLRPKVCRPSVEALEDRLVPAAMLMIGAVTILEGNDGTQNALVTVSLTEPPGNSVTVNYATADGSALAGSDYDAVSGKLLFKLNEMSKQILIPIRGDRIPELDKSFFIRLSDPKGAKILDGEALATIVDNEPRISVNDVSMWVGNATYSSRAFMTSMSGAYDLTVTAKVATVDGSAIGGAEFLANGGTLYFDKGQPSQLVAVVVTGDRVLEPNESFLVNLRSASSYAEIGKGAGVGAIMDDEPRISVNDVSV